MQNISLLWFLFSEFICYFGVHLVVVYIFSQTFMKALDYWKLTGMFLNILEEQIQDDNIVFQ